MNSIYSNINTIQVESNLLEVFLRRRCSENMQEIITRTPTRRYDFNEVGLQLYLKSHFGVGVLFLRNRMFSPDI